jgi:PIN domain nuclease of toxin-antitoxin system
VIVLDTHAWVWWQTAPRKLSRAATRAIENADAIGICTISVLELVNIVERRGAQLDRPVRAWVVNALAQERVEELPLTAEIALDAGQLRFDGDPADRIIYATARAEDAPLVTGDERIRGFDAERTIW